MNVQAGREAREFRYCQIGIRPPSYGLEILQCCSSVSSHIFPYTTLKMQKAAADAQALIRPHLSLLCLKMHSFLLSVQLFPEHTYAVSHEPSLSNFSGTLQSFSLAPGGEAAAGCYSHRVHHKMLFTSVARRRVVSFSTSVAKSHFWMQAKFKRVWMQISYVCL